MLFPVSDELEFRRPVEEAATGPQIGPLKVFGLAVLAMIAGAGGYQGARIYFEAVAAEQAEHDAALRRDVIREMKGVSATKPNVRRD